MTGEEKTGLLAEWAGARPMRATEDPERSAPSQSRRRGRDRAPEVEIVWVDHAETGPEAKGGED